MREVAPSAVEPTLLGEFVEVVVRVPIDRASAPHAVWGFPDDMDHAGLVQRLREHYRYGVAGFVNDVARREGTQVVVRLRARHGHDVLRDEFIDIWEASGGTGSAG